jgi:hypothetical protein
MVGSIVHALIHHWLCVPTKGSTGTRSLQSGADLDVSAQWLLDIEGRVVL